MIDNDNVTKGKDLYCFSKTMMLHFNPKVTYSFPKYYGRGRISSDTFMTSPARWSFINAGVKLGNHSAMQQCIYMSLRRVKFPSYLTDFAISKHLNKTIKDGITFDCIMLEVKKDINWLAKVYTNSNVLAIPEEGIDMYPRIVELYKDDAICKETLLLYSSFVTDIFRQEASKDILSWPCEIEQLNHHKDLLLYLLTNDQRDSLKDQFQVLRLHS